MHRILAALVVVALTTSAIPSAAIAPLCHRCCDEPRLDAGDGQMAPCCRVSPGAPRPVARQAQARDVDIATVLTTPSAGMRARSGFLPSDRGSAVVPRHRLRFTVLRI